MSHPFGDVLMQFLHRKHGLSQSKLAAGILQAPSVITDMAQGRRLTGPQARERVVAIIRWLHQQGSFQTLGEANQLLEAAGLAALTQFDSTEAVLVSALTQPPIPSLQPTVKPAKFLTNLPAQLTSFIGRTGEIAEIARLFSANRLITLTGAGGVGKTRLAIEMALKLVAISNEPLLTIPNLVSEFPDGIWLVEFAAVKDPVFIAQTLTKALRLPDRGNRAPIDTLLDHLADRKMLLVLDNCEHLIQPCAELVEKLLTSCWSVRVLATSREVLRVPGEAVYRVPPLGLPASHMTDPGQIFACDAARLFVERATCADSYINTGKLSDAKSIGEICRLLDGIALALELAAPMTSMMALDEIAARLANDLTALANQHRTAITRHQTMEHALAWSYDLLTMTEKTLLTQLSVFSGGWTIEAMCEVCLVPEAVRVLHELVQKSLVIQDKRIQLMRYRLLEPIRQFAHAKLVASGVMDVVRRRHAEYMLALAQRMQPVRDAPVDSAWLEGQESANLKVALRWGIEQQEVTFLHELHAALLAYWLYAVNRNELEYWIEASLSLPQRDKSNRAVKAEAKALHMSAHAAVLRGDLTIAAKRFEHTVALFSSIGDATLMADAKMGLAHVRMIEGRVEEAQVLYEKAMAIFEQEGSDWGRAWCTFDMGYLAFVRNDLAQAQTLLEAAIQLLQAQHIEFGEYRATIALAHVMRRLGNYTDAQRLYQQALGICQKLHFRTYVSDALEGFASTHAAIGACELAATIFAAAGAQRARDSLAAITS